MPRTVAPLLAAALLFGPAAGHAQDARAVLTRAVEAHGGEAALAKYRAGKSRGKGTLHGPGGAVPFTLESVFQLPDKAKDVLELDQGGRKVRQVAVVNGATVTITEDGRDVPLPEAMKQNLKEVPHIVKATRLVPLLKEKEYELTALPEIKVDGRPAAGVRVSAKGHKDLSLYFDKETGLLAKMEHKGVDARGREYLEERVVGDYRKADGLPSPRRLVISRDGRKVLEVEAQETKYFEKLDDREFAR